MVAIGYTKVRSLKRSGRRLYTKARECPNPLYLTARKIRKKEH